jgi:hypothetical protein
MGRSVRDTDSCENEIKMFNEAYLSGQTDLPPNPEADFWRDVLKISMKVMKLELNVAYGSLASESSELKLLAATRKRLKDDDPEDYVSLAEIYGNYINQTESEDEVNWCYKQSSLQYKSSYYLVNL